jgi:hypothetical protein
VRWAVAAIAALAAAGCGATPRPVDLCGNWPDKPGNFGDVTAAWTRHAEMSRDYQQVLTVDATFKSPEWRVAHVARTAKARGLDAEATAGLLAEHKAAAIAAHEIELIVTTWDRKENELARPNPVWTVTLIDGNGRSIAPLKIRRDKRPKHILRAEFPAVPDFYEAYVASFPADPPVLVCGIKTVRLRVASERGSVELVWNAP